jgi:hypothetical protein
LHGVVRRFTANAPLRIVDIVDARHRREAGRECPVHLVCYARRIDLND